MTRTYKEIESNFNMMKSSSDSDKKKIRTGIIAGAGAIVGMAALPVGKGFDFSKF